MAGEVTDRGREEEKEGRGGEGVNGCEEAGVGLDSWLYNSGQTPI